MALPKIEFKQVAFTYQPNTPFAVKALDHINLKIPENSYTAIVGHTGSGKSTIIQLLDGLLLPTSGSIRVDENVISAASSNAQLGRIRSQIGIVFQFPEAQLFEETVLKDIAFGPRNFGKSEEEAFALAREAMQLVGLDADLAERSPFELSGGQMRRVAIAGVLAMKPSILILDEPTAGLDPRGQRETMQLFERLHVDQHVTVILVTHQMEDAAQYADQIAVMNGGQLVKVAEPAEIFANPQWLKDNHLTVPKTTQMAHELERGGFTFNPYPLTLEQLAVQIKRQLESRTQ